MENKKELLGKTFITNQNYKYKVIEKLENNMYRIMFLDENKFETIRCYQSVYKGKIKNPFHPTCYGVGYIGCDKTIKRVWKYWSHMIERCYSEKTRKKQTSYKDVKMCKEWLNYKNFEKWAIQQNYYKNYELDKDVIEKGNKIYCPEKCCFIPMRINVLLTDRKALRGNTPLGVSLRKDSKKYRARCYDINGKLFTVGAFDKPEEAFYAYKEAKEKLIKEVAEQYKDKISEKVYNALYNYKIEITD